MAVVNHLAVVSQFAQRSLESDPVGPQILQQTLPPVRAFFDDLVELCFRYPIAPARLDKYLAPDTTVAKSLRYSFGQFLTLAGSTLIDSDDRHDSILLCMLSTEHRRIVNYFNAWFLEPFLSQSNPYQ